MNQKMINTAMYDNMSKNTIAIVMHIAWNVVANKKAGKNRKVSQSTPAPADAKLTMEPSITTNKNIMKVVYMLTEPKKVHLDQLL